MTNAAVTSRSGKRRYYAKRCLVRPARPGRNTRAPQQAQALTHAARAALPGLPDMTPRAADIDATAVAIEVGVPDVVALHDALEATVGIEGQPDFPVDIDGISEHRGRVRPPGDGGAIILPIDIDRIPLQQLLCFLQGGLAWHKEPQICGVERLSRAATGSEDGCGCHCHGAAQQPGRLGKRHQVRSQIRVEGRPLHDKCGATAADPLLKITMCNCRMLSCQHVSIA